MRGARLSLVLVVGALGLAQLAARATLRGQPHGQPRRRHQDSLLQADDKQQAEQETRSLAKHKRQVLDLAVNRLQILESLDGQLREFVEAARRRELEQRQRLCLLALDFRRPRRAPSCLRDARLRAQIPPYMLNLYSQLTAESRSLADAVRLMPYNSLIARSFRQPLEDAADGRQPEPLSVELNALEAPAADDQEPAAGPAPRRPPAACAPAASERGELCFWFRISERVRRRLNASSPGAERLVEAELHVFKLLPDSEGRPKHNASASHLKTNLLEVSLYQLLPRRAADPPESPLRLLDIRRVDLNSSGWETFYVKRALDDWLRDARANLGLVIRAKSMFGEPIRIGLIRFADVAGDRRGGHFGLSHQPILVIYSTLA